ncbi:calcium-binding protein, partial [Halocynthiibacter sp.]|uniref:calcium-binding protein n=1 Tax=Halocynthiibacter sp. TaxID=1979210 RepID=UPI003C45870B
MDLAYLGNALLFFGPLLYSLFHLDDDSSTGTGAAGEGTPVAGTAGDDNFTHSDSAPRIYDLLGGDDTVTAGAGNDTVHGGDGDDSVNGNAGEDTINGGAGDDHLYGSEG